ncbi:MAG: hypothetical protein RL538_154 [Candidatus Parcubacteria bacterium]|jgi:hypothetical protein
MVTEPPKTLPKIRTYAQDLEIARTKSGESVPVVAAEKIETPKLGKASTTIQEAPTTPTPNAQKQEVHIAPPVPSITKIPAFHELQKKTSEQVTVPHQQEVRESGKTNIKAPATPSKRTVSIRAKKTDLKQPRRAGGGAIITDGRKTEFSLFSSVTTSIKNWFSGVGKAFKKKEAPKYTITDTERRKGVIQKATSKTGSIFTADSDTLREEIRRRQTQKSEDPDITWSPNTEPGFTLLDSGTPKPAVTNVVVEFKKQSTPAPSPNITAQPVRIAVPPPVFVEPTTPITPEPDPAVVAVPEIQEIPTATIGYENYEPATESNEVGELPEEPLYESEPQIEDIASAEVASATPYELTTPEAHYKVRGLGDITRLNTNTLSLGVVAVIASFLVIIVGARALIGFVLPDTETVESEQVTALTKNAVAVNLTHTSDDLEAELSSAALPEAAITEIRLTAKDGSVMDSSSALTLLGIKTGLLGTSVTEARLIVTPQGRALVLKIKDSTTTFGQLLSLEGQLPGDLSRIFATTYQEGGTFYDVSQNGIDTRVYKTANSESLTYGFTDGNTVIIAKDPAVFKAIVGSE